MSSSYADGGAMAAVRGYVDESPAIPKGRGADIL